MADHHFKPGNKGGPGRPKGSKSKVADHFWTDLLELWETDGKAALKQMRQEDNTQFVRVVASQLPRDVNLNVSNLDELSITELEQRARQLGDALGLLGDAASTEKEERPQQTH